MARDLGVPTTGGGVEPNVDPDRGHKVGEPCEPELLLFAGMNDHLHAAGLLEPLRRGEPTLKKIWDWEAIQTLFAAMNQVPELVTSRLGSKTKVVFVSSPGYAGMPPALQFVYAMLILIAEENGWRMLMAAPNLELESVILRLLKSDHEFH